MQITPPSPPQKNHPKQTNIQTRKPRKNENKYNTSLSFSCRLLSVLQSQPEILAEEEIMLHLYDLVWKLNGTLAKPHLNKLIKVKSASPRTL